MWICAGKTDSRSAEFFFIVASDVKQMSNKFAESRKKFSKNAAHDQRKNTEASGFGAAHLLLQYGFGSADRIQTSAPSGLL